MELPIYQVDAFTDIAFCGNPAAVCPLNYWLDDALMQKIAAENNVSETAFFVREGEGYRIRWFTPKHEVPLCGHATIAAAHVLWFEHRLDADTLHFESLSGTLTVTRKKGLITLNFPSRPITEPLEAPELFTTLGEATPLWAGVSGERVLIEYADESTVVALAPQFSALSALPYSIVYATAKGKDYDFVARVFAPAIGIDEDPVTGSAYTSLTPYWSQKLGNQPFRARQVSARGGDVFTELKNDRVMIAGHAVSVFSGTLWLP